jgi:hypothetical protein
VLREYIEYQGVALNGYFEAPVRATSVAKFKNTLRIQIMTTLVAQNFDSFVFAQGDDIKTTSLLVASKFGKLHKNTIRNRLAKKQQKSRLFTKKSRLSSRLCQ